MSKQLIEAFKTRETPVKVRSPYFLNVSEFYYDTIQGEGINIGMPASFIRLKGCHMGCVFCDTTEVWRTGEAYTFDELFTMMNESGMVVKLHEGQHFVITGGSPLLQQDRLAEFLWEFIRKFQFKPFVEIENECSIRPIPKLIALVDTWNNSPKLSNSKVPLGKRYNPITLKLMSQLNDSWFKFVVSSKDDWWEIEKYFLETNLIRKDQIILMPEGATRTELSNHWQIAVDMAIEHSVRYCSREHITLWDKKTGT